LRPANFARHQINFAMHGTTRAKVTAGNMLPQGVGGLNFQRAVSAGSLAGLYGEVAILRPGMVVDGVLEVYAGHVLLRDDGDGEVVRMLRCPGADEQRLPRASTA
jgi:hypothetical protein